MSGEIIAIGVAFLWTLSAMFFENAGRRIGSLNLNLIKLLTAFIMLGTTLFCMSGHFIPVQANRAAWVWMILSGLVGFVFGDYFLFKSYIYIDARYSQLMMTLAPPISAISSYLLIGEQMQGLSIIGMLVCLTGIAISILKKGNDTPKHHQAFELKLPWRGVLCAFLAAIGQGLGIVLSKQGMLAYETVCQIDNSFYISFAATQMRIIAGIVGFSLLIICSGGLRSFLNSFKNHKGIGIAVVGSIFGPFLGVSLSLLAVQHANTAVASTIMAMVPIIILLPDRLFLKRKITRAEVLGALISVAGVSLFFI